MLPVDATILRPVFGRGSGTKPEETSDSVARGRVYGAFTPTIDLCRVLRNEHNWTDYLVPMHDCKLIAIILAVKGKSFLLLDTEDSEVRWIWLSPDAIEAVRANTNILDNAVPATFENDAATDYAQILKDLDRRSDGTRIPK